MSEQINTGRYIPGYYIPNIRKLVDVIIKVLDISAPVFIMPLRIKTSNEIGYAEKQDAGYNLFIEPNILKKDELSDFVINLFIHEICHVKQMEDGRLLSNSANTVAVWEGTHYPMTVIQHDKRPWEIEAKRMEAVYLKRVKEQI